MGLEDATRAAEVQTFFYDKLKRRHKQTMSEWVNVFDKALLDLKEQKRGAPEAAKGWFLFLRSNLSLERQERDYLIIVEESTPK